MPPSTNKPSRLIAGKIAFSFLVLSASVFCFWIFAYPGGIYAAPTTVSATPTDDLQALNKKIEESKKQIAQYSTLLNSTTKQAQTLANALASLELTRKKLETNLLLTTQNISKTNLTLVQIKADIAAAEVKISLAASSIGESIRQTDQAESDSAIEELLRNRSISDTWDYINAVHSLQARTKVRFDDLRDLHALLSAKKDQATGEKTKLLSYQKTLADQRQVVALAKQEKDMLLVDTKNRAAIYNKNLAAAIVQEQQNEKELFDYESRLKAAVNPGSIPSPQAGILRWPLDSVSITQYFGKSVSAQRLYVSGTHGGVDFRAAIGTPVYAALSGTIADTEPTRSKSGCQYGKYVLINHPNGLSTVYGHLSFVSVKPGDTVVTGDVIGYSGDTGYSTGPHLHLGLYITSGIQIVDSSTIGSTRCAGIKTVAAAHSTYLDPMAYLPRF